MSEVVACLREPYPIVSNEKLAYNVFELVVSCPGIASEARPGQFVNLYCRHEGRLLPRPISICEVGREQGQLHLVYAIMGEGTREMTGFTSGETVEVMGPFGNGFDISHQGDDHLIVAGGVGTPPMLELCKHLDGKKTIVLGFRSQSFLVDRFKRYGDVYVATDDGAEGFKGNVVELLKEHGLLGNIYGCGPTPMLKSLQQFAADNNLEAQLSLEARMGCGVGCCVGCVTRVVSDSDVGYAYKKVCKEGPVFNAQEVIFP